MKLIYDNLVYPRGVALMLGKDSSKNILVYGIKGWIIFYLIPCLSLYVETKSISLVASNKDKPIHRAFGRILRNIILDCSFGFSTTLELRGVGYKFNLCGDRLVFHLGFSHSVCFKIPAGIYIVSLNAKNTVFLLNGMDRQLVQKIASILCSIKKPDSYKGKGICLHKASLLLKAGKKAQH